MWERVLCVQPCNVVAQWRLCLIRLPSITVSRCYRNMTQFVSAWRYTRSVRPLCRPKGTCRERHQYVTPSPRPRLLPSTASANSINTRRSHTPKITRRSPTDFTVGQHTFLTDKYMWRKSVEQLELTYELHWWVLVAQCLRARKYRETILDSGSMLLSLAGCAFVESPGLLAIRKEVSIAGRT